MLTGLKSYFNRVYQRSKSLREGRRRTVYTITHDSDGMNVASLTIENETGTTSLHWRDVIRVEAFKRDLYAVDLICLAFILGDNTEIEIHEEMEGWKTLVTNLPEYLPGCQRFEEWFRPVAVPAFDLNLTVIYERDTAQM